VSSPCCELGNGVGNWLVNFPAANQNYAAEWSDQLSVGSWRKLSDVIPRSTVYVESVTDGNATATNHFYRVVIPRQP